MESNRSVSNTVSVSDEEQSPIVARIVTNP